MPYGTTRKRFVHRGRPQLAVKLRSLKCLDYSCYRRSARSGLGNWSEVHPRIYPPDTQRDYRYRHDCEYCAALWAMRSLPVGTAYAVWTGIGAVGAAITGILLLGESASLARIASLALIVCGIIGLKLSAH